MHIFAGSLYPLSFLKKEKKLKKKKSSFYILLILGSCKLHFQITSQMSVTFSNEGHQGEFGSQRNTRPEWWERCGGHSRRRKSKSFTISKQETAEERIRVITNGGSEKSLKAELRFPDTGCERKKVSEMTPRPIKGWICH